MTGKIILKRIASAMMSSCGVQSLAEHVWFIDKAFVLMYHRVLEYAGQQPYYHQPGMFVTKETFERQINFLKKRFELVFLEDLVARKLKGEKFGGCCAITFDDGWRDNYTAAFPILQKHGSPATIFLATGFIGTDKLFWPEELACYLDQSAADQTRFENAPPPLIRFAKAIRPHSAQGHEAFLEESIEAFKAFSPEERGEILEYLRSTYKLGPLPAQLMSWHEARRMLDSGLVRFGAHSANHELLDQVSLQKVRDEVSASRDDIQQHLGCAARLFAYPNGNFDSNVQRVLNDYGFVAAVTTKRGFCGRGTPLLEIPRIGIHEDISNTVPMFRSRILFDKF